MICLENLYELVADGGFIIIDDYGDFKGCRDAVSDFFRDRGMPQLTHVDSNCVFFRKVA
ncbi:MAG: hypothetical protein HOH19_00875 [Kordiimonadaceae bacterium]|jgi:O-methyltransferase|nr:hypothetical protein [Kordiimonadaceae bacterium]MBT6031101.1 hypothetical protein [Kordiimonadaceae bacterium]